MDKATETNALQGHAYRPTPDGDDVITGCECGQLGGGRPVKPEVARYIHAEHVAARIRDRGEG